MPAPSTSTITIPHGLPPWLAAFVEQAQRREALLQRLLAAAQTHLDGEITVEEAASLLGRHPETIRRAIRKGALPDERSKPRGRMHIRRGDLGLLAGHRGREYDPVADAHDIAQRRRK